MAIIFLASFIALMICIQLEIPTLVGFLLTGVAIGPSGLGLISTVDQIEPIAEIGLFLLLFVVGMEFSPRLLAVVWRPFLLGGSLYVVFVVSIGLVAALIYGRVFSEGLFLGFMLSLSSTAIISKLLIEEGDVSRERGKVAMAILIFQDFMAILMLLMVPLLAHAKEFTENALAGAIVKSIFLFCAALILSKFVVPYLMFRIAKEKSRELMIIALLAICFGVVFLSGKMGLSLSMGAFLAGIVLSFGEYRHNAIGSILPFQDIFTNFFFISLGMLMNLDYFLNHITLVLLVSLGVILAKSVAGFVAARFLSLSFGGSIFVALSLAEIGEFSFVLLKEGFRYQIGELYLHQLFLGTAIVTMLVAPLLVTIGRQMARKMEGKEPTSSLKGKFILMAGMGAFGKRVKEAFKELKKKLLIIDIDPEITVDQDVGSVVFGDAGNLHLLKKQEIERAECAIIAVGSFEEERRILSQIRSLDPTMPIFVRTHSFSDRKLLEEAGATEIIDEESASFKMFMETIKHYGIK